MWQEDLRGGELKRVSAGALTYLNVPPPPPSLKGPYSALCGASHRPLVGHRAARDAPPAWAHLVRAHYFELNGPATIACESRNPPWVRSQAV